MGKRSRFSTGPTSSGPVAIRGIFRFLAILCLLLPASTAGALDLFTLWRQPQIPLQMIEGAWADYSTQVMSGGRRESGIVRVVCLDRNGGTDDQAWMIELLYLDEMQDGTMVPQAGQGTRLRISRDLLKREGALLDYVLEIEQWRDGVPEKISPEQLQEDPLIAASLSDEFVPDRVDIGTPTTRVVQGHQLLCDQFTLAAADTQVARLPAGEVIQTSTWEVVAAVNSEIPFLGLAFVSERQHAESRLDPPQRRMKLPPPRIRVEKMELVAYGSGAQPVLLQRGTGPMNRTN